MKFYTHVGSKKVLKYINELYKQSFSKKNKYQN
ncbi:hypothetical protein SAMN05421679_1019 [Epilithonimonas pallida]|uniref:Uncharacterized protein n=1 Tax=Epilithonimonas pallida TaxID=373671 RepID=A0ABY1QWP9_9FLAO|nr:hypothetical protein SAMN05421679_1019 [Epilithonimonas pallida]